MVKTIVLFLLAIGHGSIVVTTQQELQNQNLEKIIIARLKINAKKMRGIANSIFTVSLV